MIDISLKLSARKGNSVDYRLVLSLYYADHSNYGLPITGLPLGISYRNVDDIDSDNWYTFRFEELSNLPSGNYALVLYQQSKSVENQVDFSTNVIDWFHSDSFEILKDSYAFSSDLSFGTSYGFDSGYGYANIYGYGYGYGHTSPLDYFNVLNVSGEDEGYAYQEDYPSYSYGYGWEETLFRADRTVFRCFKIYDNFNDISYVDGNDVDLGEDAEYIKINLPSATVESLIFDNRQDFVSSTKIGTEVKGNFIVLSDSGGKVYSTNATLFDDEGDSFSENVEWFTNNFFLSSNDVNSADISNISGNTNPFKVYLISAPYSSGVYLSYDGGSTWDETNDGLSYGDGFRNISTVLFGPNSDFALAFDNTNSSEKGKVYYLDLSSSSTTWSLLSSDLNSAGVVVNKGFVIDANNIWVGTDNGVFKTSDGGSNWSSVNIGLPSNLNVRDIYIKEDASLNYGYGYGYGIGLDYFDVIGVSGLLTGYGVGDFESNFIGTYSYGYGYEYGFSGGSQQIVFIASNLGVYRYISSWERVYPHASDPSIETFSVHVNDKHIYVGKNDGIVRSTGDVGDTLTEIEFQGDNIGDLDFYSQGLLKRRVTTIKSNNNSEIYVSQFGGVFVSKNDGGNFNSLSNKMNEKRIKFLLNNPINNRIFYCFTETIDFSRAAMTILVDTSGSMIANDPEYRRIDMIKDVVQEIQTEANSREVSAYYQVIGFGSSEREYSRTPENQYYGGVTNLTGGFTANSTTALNKLSSLDGVGLHYRTPFFEAISITSSGLLNNGSNWIYDKDNFEYKFTDIISRFLSNLDKSLVIITDGHNTVLNESLKQTALENLSNLRGNLYIIAIGHNINFENLKQIKDSYEFSSLYLAPYNENIYNQESDLSFKDVKDVLLEREKYRVRNGTWNKIISFNEIRSSKNISFEANIPFGTSAYLQVRASKDKEVWTDWTSQISVGSAYSFSQTGKYFELRFTLSSNFISYSPEIRKITFTTINPKDSYIYYDSKQINKQMNQILLNSIDDFSLNNISENDLNIQFGIIQSESSDFSFYKKIHSGTRTVINRKEYEKLNSDDGYFFIAESGSWPNDAVVYVYDVTDGTFEATSPIEDSLYNIVPSLGLVIFYEKVSLSKKYAIRIVLDDTLYKIGFKATNYSESEISFKMHDISWMFYSSETSILSRDSLPLVASQLGEGNIYGFVSPEYISVSDELSTTYTIQYVNKDSRYSGGIFSLTNGLSLDISTSSEVKKNRFYEQNFAIPKFIIDEDFSDGLSYVSINTKENNLKDKSVTLTSSNDFKYQLNLSLSSLEIGESLGITIGDTSKGGNGIPTWFFQQNLLFDETDKIIGELETTFIVGDTDSISLLPDTSSTISGGSGFDKIISPNIKFMGVSANSVFVIAPTTVQVGTNFSFIIIATDSRGFVDKTFNGSISISLSDSSGTTNLTEYTFSSVDEGVKKFSGVITSSSIGVVTVNAIYDGTLYVSNPIVTDFDVDVKWGDLNVSTVFSDGRQDIEFAVDYAKNTSLLDFIGFSDDVDYLDKDEFNYIRYKSEQESSSSFIVIPGFRYRTTSNHGERVFLFENTVDVSTNLDLPPQPVSLSSVSEQFINISDYLTDFNYISFPVHSAYSNQIFSDSNKNEVYRDRGFNYENYRQIITYGIGEANSRLVNFVNNKEVGVEIYSSHGNTEEVGVFNNSNFVEGQDESYVKHPLRMGKRFAFLSNNGGYSTRPGYYKGDLSPKIDSLPSNVNSPNNGLTALISDSISSVKDVFSAIKNRKTYATTGARMFVSFNAEVKSFVKNLSLNIGDIARDLQSDDSEGLASNEITFTIRAVADKSNITRIQIIRIKVTDDVADIDENILDSNNTELDNFNSANFGQDTGSLIFIDDNILTKYTLNQEYCYYLRVEQEDGHIGWSSPIWFNWGRTDGIKTSEEIEGNQISSLSPVELSGFSGTINQIPAIMNGNNYPSYPSNHLSILINTSNNTPRSVTRQTPYTDRYLFVNNKKSYINGMRINWSPTQSIAYGSHYTSFLNNEDSYLIENEVNPDLQPPLNGDGINDTSYKFLNSFDDPSTNRNKYYRSYLFSTTWQYTSSSFNSGYTLEYDNIFRNTTGYDSMKDPYLFKEGSTWRMVYSLYNGSYPENSINKVSFPSTDSSLNRIEEFAGLLEDKDQLKNGYNMKIIYADNTNLSGRQFAVKQTIPSVYLGNSIAYSSSPCLVEGNDYNYHLYWLGWMIGSDNLPMLCLFCRRFNDFSNISSTAGNSVAVTNLSFIFSSNTVQYPSSYVPRKTSFKKEHFMPLDTRKMSSTEAWPELHPAYSLPWLWLSVVKQDNGVYYAVFNYLNKSDFLTNPLSLDSPGSAVLYSSNGVDFYEYDQVTENLTIPVISNKLFIHPFKTSGVWQMVYRDINTSSDFASRLKDWDLSYSQVNWVPQFSV